MEIITQIFKEIIKANQILTKYQVYNEEDIKKLSVIELIRLESDLFQIIITLKEIYETQKIKIKLYD